MNSNFQASLDLLLKSEGGFVNHPKDPGGMTNLGMTRGAYESYLGRSVTEQEMRSLTKADVAPVYKKNYWDAVHGDELPVGIDYLLFDFAANAGAYQAVKTAQKALGITADGAIGPVTLKALGNVNADEFIDKFSEAKKNFYQSLDTFTAFGQGWLNRIALVKDAAEGMLV